MAEVRHNWSKAEIEEIYNTPLMDLIYQAATIHRENDDYAEVQISSLLSIKTGGCPEDCSYCPQAARYHTDLEVQALMQVDQVVIAAKKAKEGGASRLCMGAAWREVRDNRDFDRVLEMVTAVNSLDMEVCCTLGMLTENQAERLAEAGLYAYNHNLDTSEDDYKRIITTRSYDDRLDTIKNVRKAKISVCSGGIVGLGETTADRISMLHTLATMTKHPESVPINALVPVKGTPMENQPRVPIQDMVRMIATARIVMPKSVVRLSAGRTEMSLADQALCFMAGANSIFAGDKLLTTPNPAFNEDMQMFDILGLKARESFKEHKKATAELQD
ncbi:biotin synthase BioB [Solitalea canadensis]|uniref:Biotin synthase n=1 Tax=Solitalea canadensis (strain ATCC 29591 / DSM 3403 / JCM 21819 / LMG 8368 / NBRC 15130 / NCIMB 12057 / USAM 9D) TaxID=929556 RepID=H8KVZ9_SOLCM|nr:biotin synthase BioB [Solitalea canadensis]AFD06902.1 biotin synthetase [Solitalea canadensis DSM 3403]